MEQHNGTAALENNPCTKNEKISLVSEPWNKNSHQKVVSWLNSVFCSGESPQNHESKGLSKWLAAIFIVGQMAGSGVLALPNAIAESGWAGLFMLVFCNLNALYCGICLGKCWLILEERWEEYRAKNRYPYAAIAFRASGKKMRYLASFCLDFTLLGVGTVFLILCSQLMADIAYKWGILSCYWILILAAILCPLMWLGSPEDFWPVAVIAMGTTFLATLLLIGAVVEDEANVGKPTFGKPSFESFSLAFATILFAFGGASTFPTFQNDMKDKSEFPKSACMAFVVLLLLYSPVSIGGYVIYGDKVEVNIIDSLTDSSNQSLKITIQVLIAVHLFFAFLLAVNAPSQEIEEFIGIPNKFSWKRCVVRTCVMLLILFIANTVPRFGKILDLVGGSTNTLMTFVMPPLFYIQLCSQSNPEWPERKIGLLEKIYLIQIMIVGIIGGCASTFFAMKSILGGNVFSPPCYINITAASSSS